jgi:spore maturation protein CgeB
MRVVLFCHSILSDWNHGNAHFLRGIASELLARGHDVDIYEPNDSWSLGNLLSEHGQAAVEEFYQAYPQLSTNHYELSQLDLDEVLEATELVIVHEWNDPQLVKLMGEHRKRSGTYKLLFHDTHHRAVSDTAAVHEFDLARYDGVLAFGKALKELYLAAGWTRRVWVWHEAADEAIFHPIRGLGKSGDLVWIGNWGDGERAAELEEFLIRPVENLKLKATVYGVRYPKNTQKRLSDAGIQYAGWLPNFRVPEVFSRYSVTVHIPRRPYVEKLPGIPTIRPFEALACGIPLVCSPWKDAEHLFTPGQDFLVARDGTQMQHHIGRLLSDGNLANGLAAHGLQTIRNRHTCSHRVDELLAICDEIDHSRTMRVNA